MEYGDFEYTAIGNEVEITFYYGQSSYVEIPEYINNFPITQIGDFCFSHCESLMSIEIPDSVTKIGEYAFYGCHSLEEIEIPDSVTYIGSRAFFDCSSLKNIRIPLNIEFIGEGAFLCNAAFNLIVPPELANSEIVHKLLSEIQSDSAFRYMDLSALENFNKSHSNQETLVQETKISKTTISKPPIQNTIFTKIKNLKTSSNISLESRNLLEQLEYLLKSDDYLEKINTEALPVIDEISKKQRIANLTYLLNSSSEYASINWYFSTEVDEKLADLVNRIKNKMIKPKFVQEITGSKTTEFEPKNNQNTYQNIEENDSFSSGCGCIAIIFGIIALIVLLYKALPFFGVIIIFFLMALFSK